MFAALLDLVLPRRCVGCGRLSVALCPSCVAPHPVVWTASGVGPVAAAVSYEAAVRSALIAYKERGRRDLAGPLGELLSVAAGAVLSPGRAPPGRTLLVPVPSARAAAAARGGNHVVRLARRAASANGLRVAPAVLRLARAVSDSAGLGLAERCANVANAMAASAAPAAGRWSVIVVDDIVTTGATLRESCRALTTAGWTVRGAAVVAATPRAAPRAQGGREMRSRAAVRSGA